MISVPEAPCRGEGWVAAIRPVQANEVMKKSIFAFMVSFLLYVCGLKLHCFFNGAF